MRVLRLLQICFASVVLFAGANCSFPGHVNGSGPVVRRSLTVGPFHGIVLEGSMDVRLSRSDSRTVEVEAQENMIALVSTVVRDGVWHIRTRESFSTKESFIVHISIPSIEGVRIEGSGDIVGHGQFEVEEMELGIAGSGELSLSLVAQRVSATVAGSGNMLLNGSSRSLDVVVAGSGDVDASALSIIDLDAEVAGSGNVHANATGRVVASIAGSGDIVLEQEPADISQSVAGSGAVRVRSR